MPIFLKTYLTSFLFIVQLIALGQINYDQTSGICTIISKSQTKLAEINLNELRTSPTPAKTEEKLGSFHITPRKLNRYVLSTLQLVRSSNNSLIFKKGSKTFQINTKYLDSNQVTVTISSNQDYQQWQIEINRIDEERFFGGGIQFSGYEEYVKSFEYLPKENGIGRGSGSISKWTKLAGVAGEHHDTYYPIPFLWSNQNRYLSFDDYSYTHCNLLEDKIKIYQIEDVMEFRIGFSKDISNRTEFKRTPIRKSPKWSYGTIVGIQGGQLVAKDRLHSLSQEGIKPEAIWIQDWVGKRKTKFGSRLNWTWQADSSYGDIEQFIDSMHAKEIKVLGYINPFFAEDGFYVREGLKKHYFVEGTDGNSLQFDFGGMKGYMLDLFNEEAYQWMSDIIQVEMIAKGFDGWMADFAEWYPLHYEDRLNYALRKHIEYPELWAKLNNEVGIKSRKDLYIFNRSGTAKSPKHTSSIWLGDQMTDKSTNDGMPSIFDAYISSAHSGLPWVHSDIGGYTSVKKPILKNVIRDERLLKEWMLFESFTPYFRTHEGLLPDENIQIWDKSVISHTKAFIQIHKDLEEYFHQYLDEDGNQKTLIKSNIDVSISNTPSYIQKQLMVGDDILIVYGNYNKVYSELDKHWYAITCNFEDFPGKGHPKNEMIVIVRKGSLPHEAVRKQINKFIRN